MHFLSVIGARPNFVKMAPIIGHLNRLISDGDHVLVHTGQHYDRALSELLLEELELPAPDYLLDVGSASHAVQTARVMERLEPVLARERPDVLIVSGDVNSTMAAALVAAKLGIPIAHVESGLRSFDRSMPEEINRVVTDHLADSLFVHCTEAVENLANEGVEADRIHFVGNTMIDSLVTLQARFRNIALAHQIGLRERDYLLVTLHRPALVDSPLLKVVVDRLGGVAREMPVLFPAHPRTRKMMKGFDIPAGVRVVDPLGYLEFLSLEADASAVLTDSGGVQEETTYLGVPCFTLRGTTERLITITSGTNTLLGLDPGRISELPILIARHGWRRGAPPPLWDGHAAERLVTVLLSGPVEAAIAVR